MCADTTITRLRVKAIAPVVYSSYMRLMIIGMYGKYCICFFFFFQAEDGIRDLVRSRGLGDVYKRQLVTQTSQPRIGLMPFL